MADQRGNKDADSAAREKSGNCFRSSGGSGPVGAEIFCRELQGLWPELRPAFDRRTLEGAARSRLPCDPERLAALVKPQELPRLAAALVRATL
jgi:hypothetical protein